MIDVGGKEPTLREAIAAGEITMLSKTAAAIRDGRVPKGDVLATARVAAIMAAKNTPGILPLCHPLPLDAVEVAFAQREIAGESIIEVRVTTRATARTGVEMEALTATAAALLTIYDMCKGMDRAMTISDIRLLKKSGGKTGDFHREE